ncbi:uncharacterized protein STEHIDRAFT_60168 [Stereum hirsutum FP-91666 SS1]|uniref:uncharacterized protein n=1 Tax=Stereum hirsutum (strain FP-91666) TaxID=721885 RepID=UPI0004449E9D|nr:uncharacterized protein STEHIDRAFT_60168 [Stereum hirsutum FP-91666 SS1]EIM84807.1 hypothetical protein STEHIDRAFT_60168 [Stereum hirsutum FP-91666 SS1]
MNVHVQRGRRVLAEQATQPAGAVAVTGSGPDSSPSLLDGAGPDNDIARRQSATSKGSYSRTTASPPPPSDHTPLLLPSTTTVLPSYNASITESSPPRAFVHGAGNGRADASTQTKMSRRRSIKKSLARARHNLRPENLVWGVKEAVGSVPAVLLGTLLNILDGVSYGMIIFPAAGVFSGLGPMGVSMFFVSAIISQVIYSAGASGFAGANGSMMIEVVPFFHILATRIAASIGEEHPEAVIATTLVAFAFSSVLTGLSFLLLGKFRLGVLIGFFPRHILVGCIGGVGVFLVITGLTVCTRMPDDDFELNLATLSFLFLNLKNLILWVPAFLLATILRLITSRFTIWHEAYSLSFWTDFIIIPAVFYIVVLAAGLDLDVLRKAGWIFDVGASEEKWYQFYTYFDLKSIRWGPLWDTLPTQFALLFFNILHPPLNVPALAVSLNEDVDTNKELVAHGYSNLIAGFVGSVPNYLVYVNTLLFYRVGGTTRLSGFMLAGATAVLLFIGTGPIAYIPIMVVGALIFVLGFDLVKEALWDTRHRVSRLEYITIISIMVAMTVWDFVIGVLFGIVVSCFFFVVQNSQRRSIRAIHSGETCMSTVRRPSAHRAYIREASKQTTILRLQGFLFFGTIAHVEESIRTLVSAPSWSTSPMQFLIVDMSLVAGVDMSSAEAFVRIQRLLSSKRIVLVFCGMEAGSRGGPSVKTALENVGLFEMDGVELFEKANDALEWTENAYLRAWFLSNKAETKPVMLPGRQDGIQLELHEASPNSPRRSQLRDAGWRTMTRPSSPTGPNFDVHSEPLNTLLQAFSSYGPLDLSSLDSLSAYLERISLTEGTILWHQGDAPDGLYLIESGVLRATYQFAHGGGEGRVDESMVSGTLAGELSALSGMERNATVVVERNSVLWKLGTEGLKRLEAERPELARTFTRLVLKAAKVDYDILLSALATRQ